MDVTVNDMGVCRKELRITVPAESVREEYNSLVSAYGKQARIPGFRPGKAPLDMVRRRYRQELEKDAKDRLLPRFYKEAIDKENLDVVAVIDVQEETFSPEENFAFKVVLDVPPAFDLPKYKGISIEHHKPSVEDKDIDEAIERAREHHATFVEVKDRGIQKGDFVQVNYEGVCDNQPVMELAPDARELGAAEGSWVAVGDNTFLPGFDDGLMGAEIGEKKVIQVDFGPDMKQAVLAGKQASYYVDVLAIREKKLPDLDHDLLASLGVESEQELRKNLRENLERIAEQREQNRQRNEIITSLLSQADFDLPKSIVESETRTMIYDMVRQQSARGLDEQVIRDSKDELFNAASKGARDRVKLRYILHKIGEAESLEVPDEELGKELADFAERQGVSPERLKAELQEKNNLDAFYEDIRNQKVLDFLLEQAGVTESN